MSASSTGMTAAAASAFIKDTGLPTLFRGVGNGE